MCESEGETKRHLPAVTRPVLVACSKKCAFVKPYPPGFKSLCRYGGFAPSCWQNACNAAHDHHSPSQGASAIYNRISTHVPDELTAQTWERIVQRVLKSVLKVNTQNLKSRKNLLVFQ